MERQDESDRRRVSRRTLLGTGALASLAGCLGLGDDGSDSSSSSDVAIEVSSGQRLDREPELVVTGLGGPARLELTTSDGGDRQWRSVATFEPADGRVDVAEQAPTDADYEGADPRGPFWAMEPDESGTHLYDGDQDSQLVDVAVYESGETPESADPLAETRYERYLRHPDSDEQTIEGPQYGHVVEPPADGPAPGVVLLHGSDGQPTVERARVLAAHGFTALALQYFGTGPDALPDSLVEVPVEYVERSIDWFAGLDAVRDAPIGLGGVSRGGELAMFVASRRDDVGSVVNWVGSGALWRAYERRGTAPDTSAWSLDGEPLPYLSTDGRSHDGVFRETAAERLREASVDLAAIDAPILLLSAVGDALWPSRTLLDRTERRLDELDYGHVYEHRSYEGAGHGISIPSLPTWANRTSGAFGGTRAGTAAAAEDSWPRAIEFFEAAAGEGPSPPGDDD